MIELISVSKEINDKYLLKDINLKIRKGDKIGIVGAISSGKTTLLRVILDIYNVTKGKVNIKNIESKDIGFMPSNKGLYEELTVLENIELCTSLNLFNTKELLELSKKIEIIEYLNKKVKDTSRGIQQKVALLIALSNNPKLVVLDEPISNLDMKDRISIINFLTEYVKDRTLIITSDNLNDIEELCDKVVFIKDGKINSDDFIYNIIDEFSNGEIEIYFLRQVNDSIKDILKKEFINIEIGFNSIKFNKRDIELNFILKRILELNLDILEIRRDNIKESKINN
ncbi:hypothetical protein HMPREF1092_00723 [Clostridium thermobutyricum]|uniref:ABC transporter domain-containing protein n=1 Tax=Clostridium thermobutyricum TaxID=29372 RepID=N9WKA0_9CLOT|nr:ATP-binding cassette domain-containing protein [Clostridium thermobutyricum]ENZ03536.1 hypothetical protein HMPREF1092_00723 [Clostridium thermobutyricum]